MPASEPLTIDAGGVDLRAEMHLPAEQTGVVVIPEVSATMENVMLDAVASRLRDADLGVLRIALLTEDEAADGNIEGLRPAPDVMGGRLGAVLDWMALDDRMAVLPFGLLGTDTGAAAALVAAADRAERIGAIVSALGQPALAGDALDRVGAQTLLVVGNGDALSVDGANEAARRLGAVSQVERIESAGYALRPDELDAIGTLAADWFTTHLVTMESPIEVPEPEHFEDMHADRFPPQQGKVKPNH